MMMANGHTQARRRGAMTPLAALLLILLMAMVAFAVDVAWVVQTKHQLQTAADAAALAGAQPLMHGYVEFNLPDQPNKLAIRSAALADARTAAKAYAGHNPAGEKASLVLRDEDIEFGFTDANGTYTALAPAALTQFPNTVRVTVRRDGLGNGALGLFFAPVLGTRSVDLSATAAATPYGGVLDSFQALTAANSRILPMTYDVEHWNAFVATGLDPDGNRSLAADGSPQLQIYPSLKDRGNFGELSLDDDHAGASEIRDWITNGLPPSAFQTLRDRQLLPVSAHDPTRWDWVGNPGFKASTVSEVNGFVGETYLLPLFKAYNSSTTEYQAGTGGGSNYYYNIVAFVGVKIMPADQTNQQIVVQPSAVIDANAVFNPTPRPVGTSATLVTTFTGPKLTR